MGRVAEGMLQRYCTGIAGTSQNHGPCILSVLMASCHVVTGQSHTVILYRARVAKVRMLLGNLHMFRAWEVGSDSAGGTISHMAWQRRLLAAPRR